MDVSVVKVHLLLTPNLQQVLSGHAPPTTPFKSACGEKSPYIHICMSICGLYRTTSALSPVPLQEHELLHPDIPGWRVVDLAKRGEHSSWGGQNALRYCSFWDCLRELTRHARHRPAIALEMASDLMQAELLAGVSMGK